MKINELIAALVKTLDNLKADSDTEIFVEYLNEYGECCSANIQEDNIIVRDNSIVFDIVEIQDRMWGVR